MADPNVTMMVITADLQCEKCYKKIKKVLCKFPQIRDQVYDEKQNTVTIKVVCCKPEKIMRKIRCKGGECIKNIQIKPPPKPKPVDPQPKPKPVDPKPKLKPNPIGGCCTKCSEGRGGGPCYHGCGYGYPWPCFCGYGYGYGYPWPCFYGSYCVYNHVNMCERCER